MKDNKLSARENSSIQSIGEKNEGKKIVIVLGCSNILDSKMLGFLLWILKV